MSDDTFSDWDIDDPDDCRELARRKKSYRLSASPTTHRCLHSRR